jgi:integrase
MTITKRNRTFHLRRRVPRRYRDVEARDVILISLHTDSESQARTKANAVWQELIEAWEAKIEGATAEGEDRLIHAKKLAAKRGFRYLPAAQVAALPIDDLLKRIEAIPDTRKGVPDRQDAEALLGAAKAPEITVTRALDLYWEVEGIRAAGKSDDQIRRWRNPRIKAIRNFVEQMGDLVITDITTETLFDFRAWWGKRILAGGVKHNSANKDFVYVTSTLRAVARAKGIALEFSTDGLAFKEKEKGTRPSFSVEWIRERLLAPGALAGMNKEARCILLGMVNTGYRPSEGAGLTKPQIRLDHKYPHISIEPVGRALKSASARRVIPLVGVSLAAFRECPDGFPRYADKPGLSDAINKYLRENKLLETPDHSMYSLRHAFEDRLLAAKVDERIRRDLMGHSLNRERYGAGGDLERLHAEVARISI